MRKQEQEKEYKNLEKADQEINGVIEELPKMENLRNL